MNILSIIETMRIAIPNSIQLFTNGRCYHFYKILKSIFPEAKPYYNSNHIVTKINNKLYDITGEVNGDNYLPVEEQYQDNEWIQTVEQEFRKNRIRVKIKSISKFVPKIIID